MNSQNASATNAPMGMIIGATADPAMAEPPSPAACAGAGLGAARVPRHRPTTLLLATGPTPSSRGYAGSSRPTYRIEASDLRNPSNARSRAS
jgi:hypothetical protein